MLLTLGCPVDSRVAESRHGRLFGRSNAEDDAPEIATLTSISSETGHHGEVFIGVSEFRSRGGPLKIASHPSTTPLTIPSNQGILAESSTHAHS